jgi:hypothetical protein
VSVVASSAWSGAARSAALAAPCALRFASRAAAPRKRRCSSRLCRVIAPVPNQRWRNPDVAEFKVELLAMVGTLCRSREPIVKTLAGDDANRPTRGINRSSDEVRSTGQV